MFSRRYTETQLISVLRAKAATAFSAS